MSAPAQGSGSSAAPGYEPWAWPAFAIGLCTGALLVYLGWKPGGELPVIVYRWGPLLVGALAAIGLFLALLFCWRRRPVLQRGRVVPLSVLAASLWVCSLPIAYPSSHEGKFSTVHFGLPVEGRARVRSGGEDPATNRLVFDPSRRYGVVFEPLEDEPRSALAPAAGKVVEVGAGRLGAVLVLAVGAAEFCVLEGLESSSIQLAVGADVSAGDTLGRVPGLLVMSLQDGPELGRWEGIPMRFWDYVVDGRPAASGSPVPPQVVEPARPSLH